MRLASYRVGGRDSFGIVTTHGQIVDLRRRGLGSTLRGVLERGDDVKLADFVSEEPNFELADVSLRQVIPDAAKIIAIGANYAAHAAERSFSIPDAPILFMRTPQSLVGAGEPIVRPSASIALDYEGELAVVIGRRGRHIAANAAQDFIAGYCCFNDGSVRDFQKTSIDVGKNFDASGACGPWLVTSDEAGQGPFKLTTRVNGEQRQHASTSDMIFSIGEIIAYASIYTELLPGDIIATGTPAGVAARETPPRWLKSGDRIEIEISGIGMLHNVVVDETSSMPSAAAAAAAVR